MRFGHEWHDNASTMRGIPTVSLKSSATSKQEKLIYTVLNRFIQLVQTIM